jgi:hypothetical protein
MCRFVGGSLSTNQARCICTVTEALMCVHLLQCRSTLIFDVELLKINGE